MTYLCILLTECCFVVVVEVAVPALGSCETSGTAAAETLKKWDGGPWTGAENRGLGMGLPLPSYGIQDCDPGKFLKTSANLCNLVYFCIKIHIFNRFRSVT